MNKLRADYLQAMGVDLYVHRLQVDSAQESSSVDTPEAELNKDVDEGGDEGGAGDGDAQQVLELREGDQDGGGGGEP